MRDFAQSFRDLDVYREALELAVKIHDMARNFPPEERYVLATQLYRASHSVCQNIAEAWRKRRYRAAFVAKLSDAETEAGEVQCCLDIAGNLGYIDETMRRDLDQRYEAVLGMLVRMIDGADKWCTL